MGQRLNIEIHRKGQALANAYYHWSAYTQSALELVQEVLSAMDEVTEADPVIEAVRLLEATEAGMAPDEKERVNQVMDASIFKDYVSRNSGIISITDKGMEGTRLWQEGRVIIDLDEQMIQFDVCYLDELGNYEDDEELYEEMKEKFDAYSTHDQDIRSFSFDELGEVMGLVDEVIDCGEHGYKLENGYIIGLIA